MPGDCADTNNQGEKNSVFQVIFSACSLLADEFSGRTYLKKKTD